MPESVCLLCVDDEEHILKTMERFCRNENIPLLTASSAAQAKTILEQHPVTIIISDYQMPETNGLEFLREVGHNWPQTVRIIISGFIETAELSNALLCGEIFGFLPKPWQRSKLKTLIQRAVEQYNTATK